MNLRFGLSMRVVQNTGYEESRDAISHDWLRLMDRMEIPFILIPNVLEDPIAFVRKFKIDVLFFTNGEDLPDDGENTAAKKYTLRDQTEHILMNYALKCQLPVFGVCRGFQFINHFFGGTLFKNLDTRPDHQHSHVSTIHRVELKDQFLSCLNVSSLQVNSFHRHGVLAEGLSNELIAWAVAQDGVVEAFRHRNLPIWAVQWHPERGCEDLRASEGLLQCVLQEIKKVSR